MHKCTCGRNILINVWDKCSQCLFDAWVKENPRYCDYCGKFLEPSTSDRYSTYKKARYHHKCLTAYNHDNKPKKIIILPDCKCGCGKKVKTISNEFHSPHCYTNWRKANGVEWGKKII